MRWLPSLPVVVLAGIVLASVFAIGYAGATSTAAFGPYTTTWEGTAEFRDIAAEDDREVQLAETTHAYDEVPANGTIAIVIAPDEPYASDDLERMRDFVDRGGTLLVMDAYGPGGNAVLDGVGATTRIDGDPLRDDIAFGASPAFPLIDADGDHSLARNVDAVEFNHGSALVLEGATPVANSSDTSYLDRGRTGELDDDDPVGPHSVVAVEDVGSGEVIVVSDPSVFINVMLEREDNAALARSVIEEHDRVLFDVSHDSAGVPPLIAALSVLRESIALQLALAVGALVAVRMSTNRGREWLVGESELETARSIDDEDAIHAYIADRHPDWDDERIERVARALTAEPDPEQPNRQRVYSHPVTQFDR